MDNRIEIWDVFHDGEMTAFSEEDGDTFTIFVSIPYLRRRIKPLGDSFVLTLSGVENFEFHNSDGTITPACEEVGLFTLRTLQRFSLLGRQQ